MQLCIQLITIKFSREFLSDTADTDSATANTELYTANPEKRHRKLEIKYDITITLTIYFYVSDKIYSKTTSPPPPPLRATLLPLGGRKGGGFWLRRKKRGVEEEWRP